MKNNYTAVIKQDGDWWIGWIEEVPGVNCQEATREELLESLRVTLREALEFNREDAVSFVRQFKFRPRLTVEHLKHRHFPS